MKKFVYIICFEPDDTLFKKTCALIEKESEIREGALLEDVDGSLLKCYSHTRGEIVVFKSYYFDDEVRVESDFELEPYLGSDWFIKKILRVELQS